MEAKEIRKIRPNITDTIHKNPNQSIGGNSINFFEYAKMQNEYIDYLESQLSGLKEEKEVEKSKINKLIDLILDLYPEPRYNDCKMDECVCPMCTADAPIGTKIEDLEHEKDCPYKIASELKHQLSQPTKPVSAEEFFDKENPYKYETDNSDLENRVFDKADMIKFAEAYANQVNPQLDSIVIEFAKQMEHELEANKHKGDWKDWGTLPEMIWELEEHKAKMILAIKADEKERVKELIADQANILMMIGNVGNLYNPQLGEKGEEK